MRKKFIILLTGVLFTTCGIEEYYYLPQVPENSITPDSNIGATIIFPAISSYYYARNYEIFYKIYISDHLAPAFIPINNFSLIHPSLYSDYYYFSAFTNPVTSSTISANTFRNRNYFQLALDGININSQLSASGGTLRIEFLPLTGPYPIAAFNGGPEIKLRRSLNLISPQPSSDLFFRNSSDLRAFSNAISNVNADVAGQSSDPPYAYVSMYIVAVGTHPANFTPIYSKPTHINVFKLPE